MAKKERPSRNCMAGKSRWRHSSNEMKKQFRRDARDYGNTQEFDSSLLERKQKTNRCRKIKR